MRKTKTITLQHNPAFSSNPYHVVVVTDSLEFTPGQNLTRKDAEALCVARDWKVTIKGA
jgi:hypothetical protein